MQKPSDGYSNLALNLSREVKELSIGIRALHCFKSAGIRYIGDLIQKSASDLLAYENFGVKTLIDVQAALKEINLRLGVNILNGKNLAQITSKNTFCNNFNPRLNK